MCHARIVAVAVTTMLMLACYAWGGGVAAVAALIVTLPAVALTFDNPSGTFFVIAILVLIVFAVLLGLLSLMAITY